ncbi:MAG: hypothetical protein V3T20_08610, partial [Gemmatimonadota bacterium]
MNRLCLLALLIAAGAEPPATPPVAPAAITIRTSRGESAVPVALHEGHAALPIRDLSRLLPIADEVIDDWAIVAFAGEPFRFLLGAPVMVHQGRIVPLVGGAYVVGDTLFVPLQWLAEHITGMFSEGYRYDPRTARFEEARLPPIASALPPQPIPTSPGIAVEPPSARARETGFRMAHTV